MPITQDRMIALIDCSLTFMTRLEALQKLVVYQRSQLRNSGNSQAMAVNQLEELSDRVNQMATFPMAVIYRITSEQAHFAASKRKNEIAKEAVRRWRRRRKTEGEGLKIEFEDYITGSIEEEGIEKAAVEIKIDEELIVAIDEVFNEAPNGNSMITQDQLTEVIEETLSITDPKEVESLTYKLLESKIIQHAYRPGPEGIWIRGDQTPVPYQPGMWLPSADS